MTRVRVRRDRPTALAWAVALAVTMLVVYLLTLNAGGPDVVESVSAAPRVTREIEFEALEIWCVSMAQCDTAEEARLRASGYTARGAAGYVAQIDGAWHVLGAAYASERDAKRIAERLRKAEGIEAQTLCLAAEALQLRITAPERQIEAVAAADALLREQTRQLGEIALQLDRDELRPDGAQTLCAVAATEAAEAARALDGIPGAADNRLCASLIGQLDTLARLVNAVAASDETEAASLSGMVRCAQIEVFIRQREAQDGLGK